MYYVKGRNAGPRSQICEWICGSLALALDLPIAPFALAYVPDELLDGYPGARQDLGAGWAFASLKQQVRKITQTRVAHVPAALQQAVFAFDWWIANADRTLGQRSGNPNLFWEPGQASSDGRLVVIDHNQAFDPDFSKPDFVNTHVSREQGKVLLADAHAQKYYADKFSLALQSWQTI